MKPKFVIIPIAVFLIIFVNAFFGHLIFDFGPAGQINKYSNYVHLLSDWSSHPRNIIFDVTTVWQNPESNSDPYYDDTIAVTLKTEYNENELRYLAGKSYVQLNHEYSDCQNIWKPFLYRYALDSVSNSLDNLAGIQTSSEPYIVKYSEIITSAYSASEQQDFVKSGFSQFIPICSIHDSTSYDYSVKTSDETLGVDVYFVPSISERERFHQSSEFSHYPDCSASNIIQFSGSCSDVGKNSGLLIVIPDKLNYSVTKISVNLHERI